jgi:hypothetical protein
LTPAEASSIARKKSKPPSPIVPATAGRSEPASSPSGSGAEQHPNRFRPRTNLGKTHIFAKTTWTSRPAPVLPPRTGQTSLVCRSLRRPVLGRRLVVLIPRRGLVLRRLEQLRWPANRHDIQRFRPKLDVPQEPFDLDLVLHRRHDPPPAAAWTVQDFV